MKIKKKLRYFALKIVFDIISAWTSFTRNFFLFSLAIQTGLALKAVLLRLLLQYLLESGMQINRIPG